MPDIKTTAGNLGYLEGISNPEDLVLREHLEFLARQIPQRFSKQSYGRAFHFLVDGAFGLKGDRSPNLSNALYAWNGTERGWSQIREVAPIEGLQIVKREAAGVSPYDDGPEMAPDARIISEYGVIAGSIVKVFGNQEVATSQTLRAIREDLVPRLQQQI